MVIIEDNLGLDRKISDLNILLTFLFSSLGMSNYFGELVM
jgi:hypothetical protein